MITPGLNHPGLGALPESEALELLESLREGSEARALMVVDRSGAVVLSSGLADSLDEPGFASLASAHFDANRQLATLVGEPDLRGLSHQGNRTSVYLADVADTAVLAVLYDGVRSSSRLERDGDEIVARLESPVLSMLTPARPDTGSRLFGSDWARDAESEIDRIFREG